MSEWRMTAKLAAELDDIIAREDAGEDVFGVQARIDAAQERKALESVRVAALPPSAPVDALAGLSKKAQAIKIYNELTDKSTPAVKAALLTAGFKAATATTYSSQVHKWA